VSRVAGSHLLTLLLAAAGATVLQAQTAAPDLSDPEVAHVAVTANSIDVELARYAQTRARNAAVRSFAATMITDHTAVNAQAAALAGRLGVTPLDNAVSQSLMTGRPRPARRSSRFGAVPSTGRTWTARWPTTRPCSTRWTPC